MRAAHMTICAGPDTGPTQECDTTRHSDTADATQPDTATRPDTETRHSRHTPTQYPRHSRHSPTQLPTQPDTADTGRPTQAKPDTAKSWKRDTGRHSRHRPADTGRHSRHSPTHNLRHMRHANPFTYDTVAPPRHKVNVNRRRTWHATQCMFQLCLFRFVSGRLAPDWGCRPEGMGTIQQAPSPG